MYRTTLKVDNVGRIVVPVAVRKSLGIEEGKSIEVRYNNEKLEIPRVGTIGINESIEEITRAAEKKSNITDKEYFELKNILNKIKE